MEHLSLRPECEGKLEKILFELSAADWHSFRTEGVWAECVRYGRYRLRNIPFAVDGFSFGDIVRVEEEDGHRWAKAVVFRGGHSTYRLFLDPDTRWTHHGVKSLWERLENLGCRCEHATERLVAVDVPPHSKADEVENLFDLGARAGLWGFQESFRNPFHS